MNIDPLDNVIFSRRNETVPVRTQFLIFTLFGDYIVQRGGKIWTGDLLYLMGLLGVSERAVRSTISRMTRKKWLSSSKYGRRSQYALTKQGQALLEAGHRRIFEPVFTNWNHQWNQVVYSLPEKKRRMRHVLRTQLSWLGFGSLAPGTWISPHSRQNELQTLISDLGVESYVDLFCSQYLGPSDQRDLVQRCWDLSDLEAQYNDFIAHYQPEYLECQAKESSLQPQDCFLRRFWLMHEYQAFPLRDPNLPPELLPPNWIGHKARALFDDYRELLGTYANEFIDQFIQNNCS